MWKTSGLLFWLCAIIVAGGLLLGTLIAPFADLAAAKHENARAERLEEESQKLTAQSAADTVATLNQASARALKADTYRAHPELYLVDAVRALLIVVLLAAFFGFQAYIVLLYLKRRELIPSKEVVNK